MKIVIDIPEEEYEKNKKNRCDYHTLCTAIKNGTPLPKGHGRLIDADALLDESYQIDSMHCMYDEVVNVDDIKDAPTIIEGSESE